MKSAVRRKLEMGIRARDFSRAHPSTDANYETVVARLADRITRAEVLAQQQLEGETTSRRSTKRRNHLRAALHDHLLRYIVRAGDLVAKDDPALDGVFTLPPIHATNQAYQTAARSLLERAQEQKEVLAQHGMSEKLLDDLAKALDDYGVAVGEANAGRASHVGAVAEYDAVISDIVDLVELLDALNRYRFRDNRELRAAWESARNVVAARTVTVEEPVAGTPGGDTAVPAA